MVWNEATGKKLTTLQMQEKQLCKLETPRSQDILCYGGHKYKAEFMSMISEEYQVKVKPKIVWSPQANAIIERGWGYWLGQRLLNLIRFHLKAL